MYPLKFTKVNNYYLTSVNLFICICEINFVPLQAKLFISNHC